MMQWFLRTLAQTIVELYMTKYIIGEISGSGGTTLCKNLSDTVLLLYSTKI